jgi:hypothetical protein
VGSILAERFGRQLRRLTSSRGDYALTYHDLFDEGVLGLMRAAKTYDPARGAFGTYAKAWVSKYVLRVLGRMDEWRLNGIHTVPLLTDCTVQSTGTQRETHARVLLYLYELPCTTRAQQLGRMIAIKLHGLDGWRGAASSRQHALADVANTLGLTTTTARTALAAFETVARSIPYYATD